MKVSCYLNIYVSFLALLLDETEVYLKTCENMATKANKSLKTPGYIKYVSLFVDNK